MRTYVYKCIGCKQEVCRDLEKPEAMHRSYCATAGKTVRMMYLRPHGVPMKKTHYANKLREDGTVSAICFSTPRAIDLRRATWTNRSGAVTCSKCLDILNTLRSVTKESDEP